MLSFFRKYQRQFLIVFSVILISSFCFFGIAPQPNFGGARPTDQVIGKAVDGSLMKRSEIDHLMRLLGPTMFNDGVLEKDFLETSMARMLIHTYFDQLREGLEEKFAKFQKFQPYVHPNIPFISVERLWEQLMPEQKGRFEAFKKATCDLQGIDLLIHLYLNELQLPPQLMRQFLMSAERQFPSVPGDPNLRGVDLTLFRCKSVEDLLGVRFVEIAAQFIHNVAILAKQKGYKVSFEEARIELMHNASSLLGRKHGETDIPLLIKQHLAGLGIEERELVRAWQKVLLFRRMFHDYGGSVLVDRLSFEQFEGFASQGAQVDCYSMPIKVSNFNELMKLQFYIDAVTSEKKTIAPLDLPQTFLKPESVAFDELVYKKYRLGVKKIDKGEISSKISLSETWSFERENFDLIEKTFPEIGSASKEASPDEILDALSFELRLKVDEFARSQIVSLRPAMIAEALAEVQAEEQEYFLTGKGPFPFEGITDRIGLMVLLDTQKEFSCYSQDGKTYYSFQVVEVPQESAIFTFQEADKRGILDNLLEQYLEKEYPNVRTTSPTLFQNKEGSWLPFREVKSFVGEAVYGPLLKALPGKTLEEKCQMRLKMPMEKALDHLRKGHRHVVKTEDNTRLTLADQWLLQLSEIPLRKGALEGFNAALLTLKPGAWSDVMVTNSGEARVCQIKKLIGDEGNYSGIISKCQADLSKDARCFLMERSLKQIHDFIY